MVASELEDELPMMQDKPFRLAGKIVSVAFGRLGHTPPAEYLLALLVARGAPCLVVTYGTEREEEPRSFTTHARLRLAPRVVNLAPRRLRPTLRWLHLFAWLLWRSLRDGRPQMYLGNGLGAQTAVWLVGKLTGVPHVVHVHEVEDGRELSPLNSILFKLEGPTLRGAALRIFPGTRREGYYRERYRLPPSRIAFNCPPRREAGSRAVARAAIGFSVDAKVLLYVGGIGPINCIRETVEALPFAPDLQFVMIGWAEEAYLAEVRAAATRLGVTSRVHVRGEVPDKWIYLDAADATLCLFKGDSPRARWNATSSNKIMESLAAGAPIVVAPGEDYRELLARDPVGVAVDDFTPAAIGRALASLFADDARLAAMRSAAVAAHARDLNYEAQGTPIAEELVRLAARRIG